MNRPITVLFDANPLVSGQKSGVGYYSLQLIEALAKNYPDELQLTGHYFNFLGRKKPRLPSASNIRYKTSTIMPGKVLSVLRRVGLQLPFEVLIKSRGNIALFPNYVSLPLLQPIKKVVAIHDLCFEDFPQYLQPANRNFLKRFVPKSVKNANLVITISESTKKAIQKHYHIASGSFLITPIPPSKPVQQRISRPKNLSLPKKYILFMSTLEPRKNYLSLVRAYSLLPDKLKNEYGLVLAGGYGWETAWPLAEIKQLQAAGDNIIVTGYVNDEVRAFVYQNASMLVMPSYYEGFGMPILEAMSYGVPTAVSDIPVFHEIAGEASAYFNQHEPADIADVMRQLLSDKAARKRLIAESSRRLELFDWDTVAADVMDRFRSLVDD